MKRSILFLIVIFCGSCGQNNHKKVITEHSLLEGTLQTLLREGEYFKLRKELQQNRLMLTSGKLNYFQAFVESAFNKSQNSILLSESILNKKDSLLKLTIGEKKVELREIATRTQPAFKGQKYKGNIGQDVIKEYNEMVLNFESMYLNFR